MFIYKVKVFKYFHPPKLTKSGKKKSVANNLEHPNIKSVANNL